MASSCAHTRGKRPQSKQASGETRVNSERIQTQTQIVLSYKRCKDKDVVKKYAKEEEEEEVKGKREIEEEENL